PASSSRRDRLDVPSLGLVCLDIASPFRGGMGRGSPPRAALPQVPQDGTASRRRLERPKSPEARQVSVPPAGIEPATHGVRDRSLGQPRPPYRGRLWRSGASSPPRPPRGYAI